MNGEVMQTLNTGLLSGIEMDEVLFYQLLNMKKGALEMSRDWMVLRTFDNSKSFTAADDYTSMKALPSRFLRTYSFTDSRGEMKSGVAIVDSAGNKHQLRQIKFEERFEYKDTDGYFYLDMKNSTIGRTGTLAGTLHLFFLQGTEDITSTRTWEFPTFAHPLLPLEVAIDQKGGIDWDRVNASQIPYNQNSINQIMRQLEMWDARLQQAAAGV